MLNINKRILESFVYNHVRGKHKRVTNNWVWSEVFSDPKCQITVESIRAIYICNSWVHILQITYHAIKKNKNFLLFFKAKPPKEAKLLEIQKKTKQSKTKKKKRSKLKQLFNSFFQLKAKYYKGIVQCLSRLGNFME